MEDQIQDFMIDVSKQIKEFYETAVIFVTEKDYSAPLFHNFCAIRDAIDASDKDKILELIVDYHLKWLRAVADIEQFGKCSIYDVSREELLRKINYTIEANNSRMTHYRSYVEKNKGALGSPDLDNFLSDLEIIEDMHSDVTHALMEKTSKIKNIQSDLEYRETFRGITDELLQWLDKIHDGMSMRLSKYIIINKHNLHSDLPKTLQQIVDNLKNTKSEPAQKLLQELKVKGKELGSLVRVATSHSLEISKVLDKMNDLDDRIKRLQMEDKTHTPSAALMALKHKKDYLENRLASLENLKTNLKSLQELSHVPLADVDDADMCVCEDFFHLRIFSHSLPLEERERLITDLCNVWDVAIHGEPCTKSIISILSAADVKEEFTDELGTFIIDEHSRKLYKLPGDEGETRYQPNEHQELVPVCDDAEHVYFYDACGRYYIDDTRQRVYKAHATASEYMMDSTGVLLKVKEVRDEVTYHYDNYGRYYINSDGKHIYRDVDAESEYENDGLGNLVRIRDQLDRFEPCPDDAHVTEDFKYLRETVGKALRECIAQVILQQPSDPVKYLSKSLIKYRQNLEFRDRHAREIEELEVERKIIAEEEQAALERAALEATIMSVGSEASYDSNMAKYTPMNQEYDNDK